MNKDININSNQKVYPYKLTPFKLAVLQNFPYIEADFDALTDYGLLCKVVEYLNNVIANQNVVQDNVTALNTAFTELKNYIDNYFTNLDVQDEINNKLDQMAESGQLQEIIDKYLSIKTLLAFDTVSDMKNANNLISGSYVKTMGFYSLDDGGSAIYKIRNITNQDVVNNATIISLSNTNLVAELIVDKCIFLKQLGAKNTEDVSTLLQLAINICSEKTNLYIDDYYILLNSVTISKPINLIGLPSKYSNNGECGFNCLSNDDIVYFNFNEGSVYCTFENLFFHNNKIGTCIKFSSRDESLTNFRVWKNQFNKCAFNNFKTAILFYAVGNINDYDYSSEMLFIDCKFYNNTTHCEFNNVQSYNTNFIATDFEATTSSVGFLLNSYGGINIEGGSIICRGSFIKLGQNENLNPVNTFIGIVNISNCRFETFTETIFDYTLSSRYSEFQQHGLNINNTTFYLHDSAILLDNNVRGLYANINISVIGYQSGINRLSVYGRNQQGGSEFSKIFITTSTPNFILVPRISGQFKPWIILNGTVKSSCVSSQHNQNMLSYNDKIIFGYEIGFKPNTFSVTIPWNIRKFIINVNGAFLANSGSITISNDTGFSQTFNYNGSLDNQKSEINLPYSSSDTTYTISSNNIWGNCYFK